MSDKLAPMRLRLAPAMLVAGLVAGLAACGPIAYVNEVTRRADDAVAAARLAEADKNAPYWYTRATQYLHKARENAARADFQGANRFGRLAAEAAEQAIVDGKDPSKRPIDPNAPTDEAPPAPEAAKEAPPEAPPAKEIRVKEAPKELPRAVPAKDAPKAVPAKTVPAKDVP